MKKKNTMLFSFIRKKVKIEFSAKFSDEASDTLPTDTFSCLHW